MHARIRRTLRVAGSVLAALVLGVAAVLGTAAFTGRATPALVVGGVVEGAAVFLLVGKVLQRRWRAVGAAVLIAVSAVAVIVPLRDPASQPAPVAGQAWWHLPSGSTIRYVHLVATGAVHRPPIVFLHGGPGIADLAGAAAEFGPLTAAGYDVYAYDQVGAGASSRLDDPTDYGVQRDVTDLEQIREKIQAPRMILIGHSYGGTLAGHYLAAHPDRVAKLVLLSPGSLDPADTSANRATSGLSASVRLREYAAALEPRALLAYLMLQANARAAHEFFPDNEADARNDTLITITAPGRHCTPRQARDEVHGTGFYRLQYPQSARAHSAPDVRPQVAGLQTPALVVKGSCDYLSWRSAVTWLRALPRSELVYLRGAGHDIAQDRPELVRAVIRAFLTGDPGPVPPRTSDAVPSNYRWPE